jgi:hypothetical protein
MKYFELTPAYGKDYKTAAEVTAAFHAEKDFEGDYALDFQLVNKQQLPRPCQANLRYQQGRKFAAVKLA